MNILESAIKKLLDTKPFYANFFLNSRIIYDKPGIETAGAALTSTGPVMVFNRKFMDSLTPSELAGLVEHETLHILFEHVIDMKSDVWDRHLANISMDLSINQYIDVLPKGGCHLEEFNKKFKLNMLPCETWHYYYQMLKPVEKELQKQVTLDEHGIEFPDNVKPGMGKEIIRGALDEAIKASKGNVPQEILRVFDSLRSESKINWKQVLANFVANATSSTTRASRKRINRRFGFDMPGKVKKRELTLGVCVDSSGSINDDQYDQFMSEISRLAPLCNKVYFVEADCVVQRVETILKGKKVPLMRKGAGGTAYQPAIIKCLELDCDAIIYFGDFDTADTPENPKKPFLWVGVGNSPKPANFGSEVRI